MENAITKDNLNEWLPYLKEEVKALLDLDEFKLDSAILMEENNSALQALKIEELPFLNKEINNNKDDFVFNPYLLMPIQVEAAGIPRFWRMKWLCKWIKKSFTKL